MGGEDEKVFERLSQSGIQSPQATKCGELLTMILMRCWPKPPNGSELSRLDVLRHALSWKLWKGYLEFFGKLEHNTETLTLKFLKVFGEMVALLVTVNVFLSKQPDI